MESKSELPSYTHIIESYYDGVLDFNLGELRQLHQASLDLEQNPERAESEPIIAGLNEIARRTIPFIMNNKIIWNESLTKQFWPIFKAFNNLRSIRFLEWGRFDYFHKAFEPRFFINILNVGSDLETRQESYLFIMKFHSSLLGFFENAYFIKPLIFKPRIHTQQLHLCDPLFRRLVRSLNFNDSELTAHFFQSEFSIKEYLQKCLGTFYNITTFLDIGPERIAPLRVLRMILNLFEYGLWTIDEIGGLLPMIHNCADSLLISEGKVTEEEASSEFYGCFFFECRLIIARILQHIIIFHYDYEIHLSLCSILPQTSMEESIFVPHTQIEPDKVFLLERFRKKKLNTHLSYILLNYLMRSTLKFRSDSVSEFSDQLSIAVTQLLAHASDLKSDFVLNSLQNLDHENIYFYRLAIANKYLISAGQFAKKIQELAGRVFEQPLIDYKDPLHSFYSDFEHILHSMILQVNECETNLECFRAYQLSYASRSLIHLIFSLLSLVWESEQFNKTKLISLIQFTFEFSALVCRDNLQCVNIFCGFQIFSHFKNLYVAKPIAGAYLLLQTLGNKSCSQIFTANREVREFVLQNFEGLVEKIANKETEITFDFLLESRFYICLLRRNLKAGKMLDQSIVCRIASIISPHLRSLIERVHLIESNMDIPREAEAYVQIVSNLWHEGKEAQTHLLIANIQQLLSLFQLSTVDYFTTEVYEKMQELFSDELCKPSKMIALLPFNIGKLILKEVMGIYSNFFIFAENNFLHDNFDPDFFTVYFLNEKKGMLIFQEIRSFHEHLIWPLENSCSDRQLGRFILKAYLPLLFKFMSGMLFCYSAERFRKASSIDRPGIIQTVYNINEMSIKILSLLIQNCHFGQTKRQDHFQENKINQLLEQFQENLEQNSLGKKIDSFIRISNETLSVILATYKQDPKLYYRLERYVSLSREQLEVLSIKDLHWMLCSHLKFRSQYKSNSPDENDPLSLIHNPYTVTPVTKKPFFSLLEIIDSYPATQLIFSTLQKKVPQDYESIVNFYVEKYWKLKTQLIDSPKDNQVQKIFRYNDTFYNTIEVFVQYFCEELGMTKEQLEHSDFLMSSRLSTLLIFADNLIKISPSYRKQFFIAFSGDKREIFEQIWRMRNKSFALVAHKTFQANHWMRLFSNYFLVSCLVQNFCEDNFVPFKSMLTTTVDNVSKLKFYHQMIEKFVLNSEIYVRGKEAIDARDKEELIPVYQRAIEEMTEYLCGGNIVPLDVYKTRIDMWVNILFRKDNDIDSKLYPLKRSVVVYLESLGESKNKEIIEFLSNKILVQDVFAECVRMLKLLYKSNSEILFKDEKEPHLNIERLIHLYKGKRAVEFSDHIIMEILVSLFGMITSFSELDLRYRHFVRELKNFTKINRSPQKYERLSVEERDKLACWLFLRQIVTQIELVVQINEDEVQKEKLVNYTFKKQPLCFFDSMELQEKFLETAPIKRLAKKHEVFLSYMDTGIVQLKGAQKNYRRSRILSRFATDVWQKFLLGLLYAIALAINIIAILFYNVENRDFISPNFGNGNNVFIILNLVDAFLAGVFMVFWYLYRYETEKEIQRLNMERVLGGTQNKKFLQEVYYFVWKAMILNEYWMGYFFHIFLAFMGLYSPFFSTLMLMFVIQFSTLMRGILFSVLRNLKRIFWTLVIIIGILNFFALLIADHNAQLFPPSNRSVCVSYFSCFMNLINAGFIQGNGIEFAIPFNPILTSQGYIPLFFIYVFAYLLVSLFFLGMFFGIIVDAFSEYSSELIERNDDQDNICFTCGLHRGVIERNGLNFEEHLQRHSIFNYLYYVVYLRQMDSADYNGVDLQIAKTLKSKNKGQFLPNYRASQLEELGIKLREDEMTDPD